MGPEVKSGGDELDAALSDLQERVRSHPGDAALRVRLFQLLSLLGQWKRAAAQLEVAGELDPDNQLLVLAYTAALRSEVLRAEVFRGRKTPLIFGEPSEWLGLLLEALRLAGEEKYRESQDLREKAFERAPATPGEIVVVERREEPAASSGAGPGPEEGGTEVSEGEPLAVERLGWVADMDTRLGPILEAVINGRYFWVPIHRIAEVRLERPQNLRDALWMTARFRWTNRGEAMGLIPTRYPGSETSQESAIRLARKSDFREPVPGLLIGAGQRMLVTDRGEFPLLETRALRCEAAADENVPTPPGSAGDESHG